MDYVLHATSWLRFLSRMRTAYYYFHHFLIEQFSTAGCRHDTAQQHRRKRMHLHNASIHRSQITHACSKHTCAHTQKNSACYHLTIPVGRWPRQIVLLLACVAISDQTCPSLSSSVQHNFLRMASAKLTKQTAKTIEDKCCSIIRGCMFRNCFC